MSATFSTWLSFASKALGLLMLTPVLLVRFEPSEITVWYLLLTLISLQTLADFGFSTTFSRAISYTLSGVEKLADVHSRTTRLEGPFLMNRNLMIQVLSTMRFIYFRMAVIAFLVIGVAGTAILWTPIQRTAIPQYAWVAWTFTLFTIGITFWGNFLSAYLQGINKIALLRQSEAAWTIAGLFVATTIAWFGGGLLPIIGAYQLFNIGNVFWNWHLSARSHEGVLLESSSKILDRDVFGFVWPAAWRSGLGAISSVMLVQHFPAVVFAHLAVPEVSAAFMLSSRIMSAIVQIAQAPFYSKIPTLSRLYADQHYDDVVYVASRGMQKTYILFAAGVFITGISAPYALDCIGSKSNMVTPLYWFSMSFAFAIDRFGAMNMQLYSLSNHIVWHLANGATGLLFLGVSFLLYSWVGPWCSPIAMASSYALIYTPLSLALAHNHFNLHGWQHEVKTFAIPTLIVIFLAIIFLVSTSVSPRRMINAVNSGLVLGTSRP